ARPPQDEERAGSRVAGQAHRHLGAARVGDAADGEIGRGGGAARPIAAPAGGQEEEEGTGAAGPSPHPGGYPATTRGASSITRCASSAALNRVSRNAITSPGESTE